MFLYLLQSNKLQITSLITYIAVCLGLFPVLTYIFTRNKPKTASIISFYLVAGFATDLLITPILSDSVETKFLGAKLFTVIEFSLLSIFLFDFINHNKKKFIFTSGSVLFIVSIIYENLISSNTNFDSITTGLCALLIISYSLISLFEKISNPKTIFKLDWIFIATTSFIIYFSGTFFIYILSKSNFFDEDFQSSYIIINSSILLVRNSLLSISFYTLAKNSNSNTNSMSLATQ